MMSMRSTRVVVLQPLDGTSDDVTSHQRLAHADLVGDQEPVGGFGVVVQAAKDVLDGVDLEVLQSREGGVGGVVGHCWRPES